MGRPLNKRYFGPVSTGDEIKVAFHDGTAVRQGWIVKQKGSKRFLCNSSTNVENLCTLVAKADGSLADNEMSITVKADTADGAGSYYVTKIAGRKATLAKVGATGPLDGESHAWLFSDAADDGAVQIEEAGDTADDGSDDVNVADTDS